MEYYNNFDYNKSHNQLDPRVVLASTAQVVSMVALALCFTVYAAIILGGVGVVISLLTRDREGHLLPQAKRGIIFGALAIVAGYYLFGRSISIILTDPSAREYMNSAYESMTGESISDSWSNILGKTD